MPQRPSARGAALADELAPPAAMTVLVAEVAADDLEEEDEPEVQPELQPVPQWSAVFPHCRSSAIMVPAGVGHTYPSVLTAARALVDGAVGVAEKAAVGGTAPAVLRVGGGGAA